MLGLNVNSAATRDDVLRAWRRAMLSAHPDKQADGACDAANALNDAKEQALLRLAEAPARPPEDDEARWRAAQATRRAAERASRGDAARPRVEEGASSARWAAFARRTGAAMPDGC